MQCPSCHSNNEGNPPFCATCGAPLPREAAPDPLIGRVFQDKYKIIKLLGEGGMGAVYVGEQTLGAHTRRVAIKTLHTHLSKDEQVRDRFQREVGTLATLEHPNTVQVFDFGTSPDGILYIVMEFVQGRSIADVLEKEGAISPDRVEKIISQICGSLAEAHSKGIIHRDLKPDNIVLTERAGQKDFVKVLDFGIAKRSGEAGSNEKKLTQQGMVLGTPPYMSPEQFTGQSLDARSDIYSLAVMAYEMLTGKLPFDAATAWEWATLHMTAAPKAIEAQPHGASLPESMRFAVMRALAKDKEQRFATVSEFSDRFCGRVGASPAEIAQHQPTSNHRSLPPEASPMTGPRPMTDVSGAPSFGAAAQSYIATPAPSDPMKGRTQMGEPLAPPMDFGTPQAPPMMNAPYPPPPQQIPYGANAYGPPPMMAQVPQFPPAPPGRGMQANEGGGSNKGLILAVAGIVAVLSIGLVAWGAGAFHSEPATNVPPLDLSSDPPPVVIAPTATTTTDPGAGGNVPLVPAGTVGPTHPTAHPTTPPHEPPPHPTTPPTSPTHEPTAPTQQPPAPTAPPTSPTPVPTPIPTPHPTAPPPTAPAPNAATAAICAQARSAALRHSQAAPALENQCRAMGGTP